MNLKNRIERLEADSNRGQERFDIDLSEGYLVHLTRTEIARLLREIDGADTGPGPSSSRRA
jgi:hypothetical protein